MWFIIVSILILVVVGVIGEKRQRRLKEEGKIIERAGRFYENATWFFTSASWESILDAVQKRDFSDAGVTHPYSGGTKAVVFNSRHSWSAQLKHIGERDGRSVYSYSLTNWKTNNGGAWRGDTMNMMQTAIEKVFLSLDPSVTVETHKMQLKTR